MSPVAPQSLAGSMSVPTPPPSRDKQRHGGYIARPRVTRRVHGHIESSRQGGRNEEWGVEIGRPLTETLHCTSMRCAPGKSGASRSSRARRDPRNMPGLRVSCLGHKGHQTCTQLGFPACSSERAPGLCVELMEAKAPKFRPKMGLYVLNICENRAAC